MTKSKEMASFNIQIKNSSEIYNNVALKVTLIMIKLKDLAIIYPRMVKS